MKGKPSALRMPKDKKQKIVTAVFDAIEILNKRRRNLHGLETNALANYEKIFSIFNYNMHLSDAFIALISGRSHQRHLKRYERQWDIRFESIKIARETGASVEEVEASFISMMHQYVKPRQ